MNAGAIEVRAYRESDFDITVANWHATNVASYPYVEAHQQHSLDDARHFFRTQVLPRCVVLVAELHDRQAGVLALEAPWVRQLAVVASSQRKGIGSALLLAAREISPSELRLFTFRRNAPARKFYEQHGFVAIAYGISPAPENEPDVEYVWRRSGQRSQSGVRP